MTNLELEIASIAQTYDSRDQKPETRNLKPILLMFDKTRL
jgi:hypothetical protein